MNSFKNLHDGLAYEICRQAEVLEEGGQIYQETRHWDPTMKHTIVMRVKETADDYRLFPEPDLAPYDLTDEFIEGVRAKLPELPDQKAERFAEQFGLSAYDARQLVEGEQTASFFEKCMEAAGAGARKLAKPVANLVINDIAGWQNANEDANLADSPLSPARAVELVGLLAEDAISSKQAKEVFAAIMDEDKDPAAIVEERGMKQVSDTGAIEAVVDAVIAANPDEVARYKDREHQGHRVLRRPVHEADARPGQPQGHQPASREEARRVSPAHRASQRNTPNTRARGLSSGATRTRRSRSERARYACRNGAMDRKT